MRGKHDYETILSAFRAGDYDILVGTQMIAKGHDIPNVTLVGIVNADSGSACRIFAPRNEPSSFSPRPRAVPAAAQTPGIVLIQTINPDHYAIRCAAAQDYEAFYQKEIEFRAVHVLSAVFFAGKRDRARRTRGRGARRAARPWAVCCSPRRRACGCWVPRRRPWRA